MKNMLENISDFFWDGHGADTKFTRSVRLFGFPFFLISAAVIYFVEITVIRGIKYIRTGK